MRGKHFYFLCQGLLSCCNSNFPGFRQKSELFPTSRPYRSQWDLRKRILLLTELNWVSHIASWPALGQSGQLATQKGAGGWTGTPVKTLVFLICPTVGRKAGLGGCLIQSPLLWYEQRTGKDHADNWIQFVAVAGNRCSVWGASVPHHSEATKYCPTAYNRDH